MAPEADELGCEAAAARAPASEAAAARAPAFEATTCRKILPLISNFKHKLNKIQQNKHIQKQNKLCYTSIRKNTLVSEGKHGRLFVG